LKSLKIAAAMAVNHGYEPQQAAGHYTLRFAGLFDLQISKTKCIEI
jgi:hypothetical protein